MISKNNTSGVVGVTYDKNFRKWRAQIYIMYKQISIGNYDNFDMAVKARWIGEKYYNFSNCLTTSSAYNYLKNNNLLNLEVLNVNLPDI